jgi:hypothetical protein
VGKKGEPNQGMKGKVEIYTPLRNVASHTIIIQQNARVVESRFWVVMKIPTATK